MLAECVNDNLRVVKDALESPVLLQVVGELDVNIGGVCKLRAVVKWYIETIRMVFIDSNCRPDCLIEWQSRIRAPYAVKCGSIRLIIGWWREELTHELNVHLDNLVVCGRRGNLQLVNINKADLGWDVILERDERATSLPTDPMVIRDVHRLHTFRWHVASLNLDEVFINEFDLVG